MFKIQKTSGRSSDRKLYAIIFLVSSVLYFLRKLGANISPSTIFISVLSIKWKIIWHSRLKTGQLACSNAIYFLIEIFPPSTGILPFQKANRNARGTGHGERRLHARCPCSAADLRCSTNRRVHVPSLEAQVVAIICPFEVLCVDEEHQRRKNQYLRNFRAIRRRKKIKYRLLKSFEKKKQKQKQNTKHSVCPKLLLSLPCVCTRTHVNTEQEQKSEAHWENNVAQIPIQMLYDVKMVKRQFDNSMRVQNYITLNGNFSSAILLSRFAYREIPRRGSLGAGTGCVRIVDF